MLAVPPAHATYPGANGKIAFGVGNQILSIDPNGSNQTALTTDTSCGYAVGGWSPDGTRIAFRRCSDIHVMNANGSDDHFVAHPVVGILVTSPTWSPDGAKIAFGEVFSVSGFPGTFNIRVINADGTGNIPLTSDGHSSGPDWSPDGTKIAFTRFGVSDGGIYTMNPDGSGATKVPNTTIQDFGSSWSPEGRQLTFSRQSLVDGHRDIYRINVDGTGLTQLTEGVHSFGSTWSPDGRKIAFVSFKRPPIGPDQYTLTLMNLDGSGQTPVTVKSFIDGPSWQPIPNRSPDCSTATATPDTLWPPNNRLAPVSLSGVTDPDGDQVTLTITGVTQDEPTRHIPDAKLGPASNQVKLRAKRSNHGDGRVYRIAFKATDGHGGECSGTATVGVPRRKNRPAADSAPPSYDSLVGTPGGGGQDGGDQHGHQG